MKSLSEVIRVVSETTEKRTGERRKQAQLNKVLATAGAGGIIPILLWIAVQLGGVVANQERSIQQNDRSVEAIERLQREVSMCIGLRSLQKQ